MRMDAQPKGPLLQCRYLPRKQAKDWQGGRNSWQGHRGLFQRQDGSGSLGQELPAKRSSICRNGQIVAHYEVYKPGCSRWRGSRPRRWPWWTRRTRRSWWKRRWPGWWPRSWRIWWTRRRTRRRPGKRPRSILSTVPSTYNKIGFYSISKAQSLNAQPHTQSHTETHPCTPIYLYLL